MANSFRFALNCSSAQLQLQHPVNMVWDDNNFYAQERRCCLAAAEAWHPDRLLPRFEGFFTQVLHSSTGPRSPLACG